jgi:uncharacterized membrane protein
MRYLGAHGERDHRAMTSRIPPESDGSVKRDVDARSFLAKLRTPDPAVQGVSFGSQLRNHFLTGLLVVGPVTVTVYAINWFVNFVDATVKPFVPKIYNPDTYLPFALPGIGLLFAIIGLMMIGALAANLLGRTLISYGDQVLGRMPIVRNVYRGVQQIFESVIQAAGPTANFHRVGLIEFPSPGIWSIVFVTGATTGEIAASKPGGEDDLFTVFMATGIVPPTGFVCFVPRASVTFLSMSVEDAAKIVISAGMVMPDTQAKLAQLAAAAGASKGKGRPPTIKPADGSAA